MLLLDVIASKLDVEWAEGLCFIYFTDKFTSFSTLFKHWVASIAAFFLVSDVALWVTMLVSQSNPFGQY